MERLQQKLCKYRDPYWGAVYEKALELSLSEKRSIPADYYSRLLADAKRTIKRDKRSAPQFASFYIRGDDGEEEINEVFGANEETPDQILNAKQLIATIEKVCLTRHKFSKAIFHFVLHGYTVSETAQKLNISVSLVKKLRAEISGIAKRIINI